MKEIIKTLIKRYQNDETFSGTLTLAVSFFTSAFFAASHLFSAVRYHSYWWLAIFLYYGVLASLKLYLLAAYRKSTVVEGSKELEWKTYRQIGFSILFLSLFMIGIVFQVVFHREGYYYGNFYVVLLYACYIFLMAGWLLRSFIRKRKGDSPIMIAASLLVIVAFLSTVLTFETLMIDFFSPDSSAFRFRVTGTTGITVFTMIFAISAGMILNAAKQLRR